MSIVQPPLLPEQHTRKQHGKANKKRKYFSTGNSAQETARKDALSPNPSQAGIFVMLECDT
jgi:hypothetical protein